MASAGGTYFIFARLWRKIGNFTYRMMSFQGKIAMDGDFRSLAAWMPLGSAPSWFEAPKNILLVKSDLKTRLAKMK